MKTKEIFPIMKTKEELTQELPQFTGTESYHRFSPLFRNILLTDGTDYLAKNAGCYWLMDIIASVQHSPKLKAEPFQTVVFTKGKGVVITDGNKNILYKQRVASSDFPISEIKLFVSDGGEGNKIIMLPSEY